MKHKKHKKVYSQYSWSNNNGTYSNWICEKCGEEGSDFSPNPENRYNTIKQKFGKFGSITTTELNGDISGDFTIKTDNVGNIL